MQDDMDSYDFVRRVAEQRLQPVKSLLKVSNL